MINTYQEKIEAQIKEYMEKQPKKKTRAEKTQTSVAKRITERRSQETKGTRDGKEKTRANQKSQRA
jgi:hypothetical protein